MAYTVLLQYLEPAAKVAIGVAKMPADLLKRIQRFPHESLLKLESAVAAHKQSGGPIKIELDLDVKIDSSAGRAALERARKNIG